ncbi:similar to Kazachstania africana KAFR_0G02290 hypothetical protein [Maudiozyma saulgeensis]|uniref:Hpc2-related domain-containing protein n=1 Tax=Maudiozyma saulgeensis TaxID=1789683 RepID=A0A1X7R0E7_9SACH|nr:similar to Kazachstania africana KAFR_0G02290 hypothetical protein [Kazachstania saulgeensis]
MANSDQEIIDDTTDGPSKIPTPKAPSPKSTVSKQASPVAFNPIANAIESHILTSQTSLQSKKTVDTSKKTTDTSKKMPNIAQELAMNRNNSRTLSPGALTFSPSPVTKPLLETVGNNSTTKNGDNQTKVKQKSKPRSKPKPKPKQDTTKKASLTSTTGAEVKDPSSQIKQVKISSLLSSDELKIESPKLSPKDVSSVSSKTSISKLLSNPGDLTVTKSTTQNTVQTNISKPPKKTTTSPAAKKSPTVVTSGSEQSTATSKKKTVTVNKPALKRTKSNSATSGSNQASSTSAKKSLTPSASKASKSKSATSLDSIKKKSTVKKATDNDKKKSAISPATTSVTTATPALPEQSKLAAPPTIANPSILSTIPSKPKPNNEKNSAISIVNIPLYSSSSNEYLDENGTVTFNLFKILKENEPKLDPKSEMELKRKRLFDEEAEAKEGTTDIDDDEDMENNEDIGLTEEQPKKKAHPMKGKNLIGKYDFEDPFIDDSEMLWEEQRASTKDGFFVFFGPLIAKGQSASFERADGTMKRGGIKK